MFDQNGKINGPAMEKSYANGLKKRNVLLSARRSSRIILISQNHPFTWAERENAYSVEQIACSEKQYLIVVAPWTIPQRVRWDRAFTADLLLPRKGHAALKRTVHDALQSFV